MDLINIILIVVIIVLVRFIRHLWLCLPSSSFSILDKIKNNKLFIKKEEIRGTKTEEKISEIELLNESLKNISVKNSNFSNFELEEENNAIISYQELVKNPLEYTDDEEGAYLHMTDISEITFEQKNLVPSKYEREEQILNKLKNYEFYLRKGK